MELLVSGENRVTEGPPYGKMVGVVGAGLGDDDGTVEEDPPALELAPTTIVT